MKPSWSELIGAVTVPMGPGPSSVLCEQSPVAAEETACYMKWVTPRWLTCFSADFLRALRHLRTNSHLSRPQLEHLCTSRPTEPPERQPALQPALWHLCQFHIISISHLHLFHVFHIRLSETWRASEWQTLLSSDEFIAWVTAAEPRTRLKRRMFHPSCYQKLYIIFQQTPY